MALDLAPVAEQVVAGCLAPRRGAPVVLVWDEYADPWFEALAAALAAAGARPVLRRRDARTLAVAAARCPVATAAGLVIPPADELPRGATVVLLQPDGGGAVEEAAWGNLAGLLRGGHAVALCAWPRPGAQQVGAAVFDEAQVRDLFARALAIDYPALRRRNDALRRRLRRARSARLRCPLGTDVTLGVRGRPWLSDEGRLAPVRGRARLVDERYFQLPGGEVYVAVHERSAAGRVCFRRGDRTFALELAAGRAVSLTAAGGRDDEERARLARRLGVGAEPLAELGIGTNPGATPLPVGTLDEKCLGTAHVAVGSNSRFGGRRRSRRHVDLVIGAPDLDVDGVPLLRGGVIVEAGR
jgi:leucyl aminopeptidase (aminopeptidase T)